jgi:hypothetical protein
MVGVFILYFIISHDYLLSVKKPSNAGSIGLVLSYLILVVALFILSKSVGTSFFGAQIFDPSLYNLRDIAKERFFNSRWITAYPVYWSIFIFCPFLVVHTLDQRGFSMHTLVILVLPFILFYLTTLRKALLNSLLALLVYYIYKYRISVVEILLLSISSLSVLGFLSYMFIDIFTLRVASAQLFDRFIFVPARLNFAYFEFSNNQSVLLYLSNTNIPVPVQYPFELPPADLVGSHVLGRDVAATAGWIGHGYLAFGFFGITLFSFLVGFTIKLYESLTTYVPARISMSVFVVFIYTTSLHKSFSTALFSGGGIAMIVILWLLNHYYIK